MFGRVTGPTMYIYIFRRNPTEIPNMSCTKYATAIANTWQWNFPDAKKL